MVRTNKTRYAGVARSVMTGDCSGQQYTRRTETTYMLYHYSMPALRGTAPALLR